MQLLRNRLARQTHFSALIALALLAVAAMPAQAATGGATASSGFAVELPESSELAFGPTRTAGASWYGPGLYGRQTACGQTLRATTIGVAHRSLPCGTPVRFTYNGLSVVAAVRITAKGWLTTMAGSNSMPAETKNRTAKASRSGSVSCAA